MNRIKQLRKFFGYTQDSLSKLLRVSRSTVAMWETSPQEPDYETLSRLSQIFNVPMDFVMGLGVFRHWDQINKYYDSVSSELRDRIPADLEMPSFSEAHTLAAWLDTRLYFEPDEIQLARWFAFAVRNIEISPRENTPDGDLSADVSIQFTPEFEAIMRAENNKEKKPTPLWGSGLSDEALEVAAAYDRAAKKDQDTVRFILADYLPRAAAARGDIDLSREDLSGVTVAGEDHELP